MKRPCIIGGEPTGESGEHIFPAALGGRRTNKGIYCGDHNSAYSPLAAILSNQLKALNAFLGVRGDHSDDPHKLVTTDNASGLPIWLSDGKTGFAEPRVLSTSEEGNAQRISMAFSNEHQLQQYLEGLRSEGKQYTIKSREPPQQFFLSGANVRLLLGGPDGLRAIGYVAQTFLAHHFPEVARDPGLEEYKAYTLGQIDAKLVWWDFDLQPDLPENSFEFGHRVVVGLDAASGVAYGRISLFSALHFATIFGAVPILASESVCVDIDPIAEHPPDDIVERRQASAMGPVSRPIDLTEKLYEPLSDGRAQQLLNKLTSRIASRELACGAEAIQKKLRDAGQLNVLEREALFNDVIGAEAQRVLNLLRYVANRLKAVLPAKFSPLIDKLVAFDATALSGLSQEALVCVRLGQSLLAAQMMEDYANGILTNERIVMLIGGDAGAAVVGRAIADPIRALLDRYQPPPQSS